MKLHTTRQPSRFFVATASAALLALSSGSAQANPQTWSGASASDGNWTDLNNWVGATGYPGGITNTQSGSIATFNSAVGNYGDAAHPVVLNGTTGISAAGLLFDTAAGNYVIGGTGSNLPLFLTSGNATTIASTLTATNAVETINAPVIIGNTAAATYTFSNNSANGTGTGAGTLIFNGSVSGSSGSPSTALTLSGTNTNANTIGGVISNGSTTLSITKSLAGTWDLTGANSYTGATAINGGTLALGSGGSLGATAVSVANGATFAVTPGVNGASNTLGGSVSLAAGSNFTMVDGATSTFTVTGASTLTPSTGTSPSLSFNIGGSGAGVDKLAITGAATMTTVANISFIGFGSTSLTTGTPYTFITAASGLTSADFSLSSQNVIVNGNLYNLTLGNVGGTSETVTAANGAVAATAAYWTGSQSSSWATVAPSTFLSNFSSNAAGTANTLVAPSANTNVTFTATTATNLSSTLDQAFTINSLAFSGTGSSGTFGSTIASGTGGTASTLTINAAAVNGNTAGVGITVAAGSGNNNISAPLILGGSQSWTNSSAYTLNVSGGVTGTANLVLNENNTTAGGITISGSAINNAGTITNSGTGVGSVLISGGVGSKVTGITESSTAASPLNITGGVAVNSAGTTLTAASGDTGIMTVSGGVSGTGSLTLANNSATANALTLSTVAVNNAGVIVNSGTGGAVLISGGIGSSVTGITENSTASALSITTSAITTASGGTTLTNTSGGQILTVSGGVGGSGALVLNNNSSLANGITLSGSNINNASTITNSGSNSGTGNTLISASFGTSVTGVTQNSTTSGLTLSGNETGDTILFNINNGTITATANNAIGSLSTVNFANTAGTTLALGSVGGVNIGALSGGGTTGGSVTHSGTVNFGGQNVSSTYAGAVSGQGDVTFTITGTQTLTGNWTYTGNSAFSVTSGTVVLGSGATIGTSASPVYNLQDSGSGNITINSGATVAKVITGLTQSSTGTYTVNGSIGASQGITDSAGTMIVGSTGNLSSGQGLTVSGTGVLTESSGGNISNLSGGGGLTVNASTATIGSSANSYFGGTTVSQGSLITSANALGNATTTGTWTAASNVITGVATTSNLTVGESITGANIPNNTTIASFTSNSITLSATPTGTGTAANLVIGQFGAFGDSQQGGTITLGSGSLTGTASILTSVGGVTIGRAISEKASYTNSGLSLGSTAATGTSTYNGNIALATNSSGGGATTLTSATGGEVDFTTGIISGAANLTIGGGGTVKLTGVNTFGSTVAGANTITVSGGTTLMTANNIYSATTSGSNLGFSGNTLILNNGIYKYGTGAGFDLSTGRTIQLSGQGGTIDTNGNAVTLGNSIGNNGTGGLTLNNSAGNGSLTLSADNTYSGGTTITSGTIVTNASVSGSTGALGSTSGALTVNGGGLNLNGVSQSVGNLSGTGGSIYSNGGSSTLTVGTGNTGGGTYTGVIQDYATGSGQLGLSKVGTGTITLNAANTYSGATSVTGGTLAIGTSSLGGTAVTLSGSNGTLQVGALNSAASTTIGNGASGSLTINSGGILTFANGVANVTSNAVDTLYVSSSSQALTLSSGVINIGVGGAGNSDLLSLQGSGNFASLSGSTTININVLSALNGTSQQLISWGSMPTGTGNFALGTTSGLGSPNYSLQLSETSAGLYLVETLVDNAYWKGAANSSWASANFTTDAAGTTTRTNALDSTTSVVFAATGASPSSYSNTTLDGSPTIDSVTFNVAGVGINPGNSTSNTLNINSAGTGITVATNLGTESISSNVAIANTQTWMVNSGSILAVSGNISGSGSSGLNKAGTGTLALSGTNSYSGPTAILAGAISIQGTDTLDGTSGVAVSSGAALQLTSAASLSQFNATPSVTLSGSGISGNGALENVSGNNIYTGEVTLAADSSIGSDSGLLTLWNANLIANNNTLTLVGAGNGDIESNIDSGNLVMAGTGTWTIDGTDGSATGTTTITSGTLQLGYYGILAGGTIAVNGGTFDLAGKSYTTGNVTGTGGTITNSGSSQAYLQFGTSVNGTIASSITDGTGGIMLYKEGTGTITLSGVNAYTGATNIQAGALNIANASALGSVGASTSAVNVSSGAALQISGGITTTTQVPLNLAGTGVTVNGALENVSGNNSYTGPITISGATSIGSDAGTLTLPSTATIGGSGDLSLIGAGNGAIAGAIGNGITSLTVNTGGTYTGGVNTTGTWTLSGTNTYSGPTTVTNGTLAFASATALPSSSTITLGSTTGSTIADLNYTGTGDTITNALTFNGSQTIELGNSGTGSVKYTATPTVGSGSKTLILGNATDTAGGTIGNLSGAISVVKTGTINDRWILNGTNSYSGPTTVNGGVLQVASGTTFSNLQLSGTVSNAILQTSGTLNLTTGVNSFVWGSNAGFSAKDATLTVTLNGGAQLAWGSNFFSNGGGAALDFGSSTSNAQVILTNNINLATSDNFQQNVYVNKGTGGDSTLLSGVISGGTAAGAASGLTKTGAGTLILSNANNSYSGYTAIEGGTLIAEASSSVTAATTTPTTTGVFGSGYGLYGNATANPLYSTIYVGSNQGGSTAGGVINPTLLIGGNYTIANAINIAWNNGTGQTFGLGGYLDAASTFSGPVTLNGTAATGNTFAVTQVATTGTHALNITGGISGTSGAVNFANVGAVKVSTTGISGAVAVTQTGAGTTTLAATNTYTGGTTVSGGNLQLTGSTSSTGLFSVGGVSGGLATATVSGTGAIGGAVTTSAANSDVAHIAPGANTSGNFGAAGKLTVNGTLSLGTGTNLDFDLSTSGLSGNDQIAVGGTLALGSALTFNINQLGATLDTANQYQLITFTGSAPSLGGVAFTTTGTGSYTPVYSIDGGGEALDVLFTSPNAAPGAAYYNGQGTDLGTFANFDTGVSNGTAATTALGTSTNVSFNANRNTVSTTTLNTGLDVNSVTFGTGSGVHSGMTINGTGTLTLEATTANGNTLGNGITVNTGGGNNTINTAVVLDNDQSWTVTDASSVLTAGGQVSGSHMLTKAGAGTVILSNASGNGYTGGTSVSAGRLLVTNTSGSGTGSGAVNVSGSTAILGGSGIISGAVTLSSGGNLYSGATASSATTGPGTGAVNGTLGGLKLTSTLGVNGGALTFALANGGTSTYANPAETTSYLNLGSTGSVSFTGSDTINLVDLTNGGLSLRMNSPYLLISASSNSMFSGLVTLGANGQLALDQNGTVLGVWQGGALSNYTALTINEFGSDGVTQLTNDNGKNVSYVGASLVLYNGQLEVVPEPGTWALMLGGLALLVFIQRRRRAQR